MILSFTEALSLLMVKSYDWKFRPCERDSPGNDLKVLAGKYVESHKLMCSDPHAEHLKTNGMPGVSFICSCTRHINCKRKHRFTLRKRDVLAEESLAIEGDDFLLTQEIGECDGPLNL